MKELGHVWGLGSKVDILLLVMLGPRDRLARPRALAWTGEISEPGEGRHQLGVTGEGSLLKVGGLQTLVSGGSLGRVIPGMCKLEMCGA